MFFWIPLLWFCFLSNESLAMIKGLCFWTSTTSLSESKPGSKLFEKSSIPALWLVLCATSSTRPGLYSIETAWSHHHVCFTPHHYVQNSGHTIWRCLLYSWLLCIRFIGFGLAVFLPLPGCLCHHQPYQAHFCLGYLFLVFLPNLLCLPSFLSDNKSLPVRDLLHLTFDTNLYSGSYFMLFVNTCLPY